MGVLVHVEAVVEAEHVEAFVAMLERGFPVTRSSEGCNGLTAYLGDDDKTIVVLEDWDSREDYEKYLAWRNESGAMDALAALLEKPLKIRFFEALSA